MSVNKHPMAGSQQSDDLLPACPHDVALTRAAFVAAKLVIARWQTSSRNACMDLCTPHNESVRARWYARTRQGLEDWIAQGGFAQEAGALCIHQVRLPTLKGTEPGCREQACAG